MYLPFLYNLFGVVELFCFVCWLVNQLLSILERKERVAVDSRGGLTSLTREILINFAHFRAELKTLHLSQSNQISAITDKMIIIYFSFPKINLILSIYYKSNVFKFFQFIPSWVNYSSYFVCCSFLLCFNQVSCISQLEVNSLSVTLPIVPSDDNMFNIQCQLFVRPQLIYRVSRFLFFKKSCRFYKYSTLSPI